MRRIYRKFEDRGVHVGFGTRLLRLARCRQSRQVSTEQEALIPNWSGHGTVQSGDLVMPMTNLSDWAEVEGRDGALYDRVIATGIEYGGHIDPILMRDILLEIDLIYGSEMQRAEAEREIALTDHDAENSYLEVLAMFGRKVGTEIGQRGFMELTRAVLVQLAEQDPTELHRLVKVIAGHVARQSDMRRAELQKRLTRICDFATPICSLVTNDTSREVGFLSRQQSLMERLHDSVSGYQEDPKTEVQNAALLLCENMADFMVFANSRASGIKDCILDPQNYTADDRYERFLEIITEQRKRIAYALDGWAHHARTWFAIHQRDRVGKIDLIRAMARDMPSPPSEVEHVIGPYHRNMTLFDLRSGVVKELHSWADDVLDVELLERVKLGRRRAAEGADDKIKEPSRAKA